VERTRLRPPKPRARRAARPEPRQPVGLVSSKAGIVANEIPGVAIRSQRIGAADAFVPQRT